MLTVNIENGASPPPWREGLRRDGMSEALANPEKQQLFLLLCTLVRANEQENLQLVSDEVQIS